MTFYIPIDKLNASKKYSVCVGVWWTLLWSRCLCLAFYGSAPNWRMPLWIVLIKRFIVFFLPLFPLSLLSCYHLNIFATHRAHAHSSSLICWQWWFDVSLNFFLCLLAIQTFNIHTHQLYFLSWKFGICIPTYLFVSFSNSLVFHAQRFFFSHSPNYSTYIYVYMHSKLQKHKRKNTCASLPLAVIFFLLAFKVLLFLCGSMWVCVCVRFFLFYFFLPFVLPLSPSPFRLSLKFYFVAKNLN